MIFCCVLFTGGEYKAEKIRRIEYIGLLKDSKSLMNHWFLLLTSASDLSLTSQVNSSVSNCISNNLSFEISRNISVLTICCYWVFCFVWFGFVFGFFFLTGHWQKFTCGSAIQNQILATGWKVHWVSIVLGASTIHWWNVHRFPVFRSYTGITPQSFLFFVCRIGASVQI